MVRKLAMPMVCSNAKRSALFVASFVGSFVDVTSYTATAFDKASDKGVSVPDGIGGDFRGGSSTRSSPTDPPGSAIRLRSWDVGPAHPEH
jgi:hypothetical protein